MKISAKFNKIYVIESLREHETKTGTRLYEDVLVWKKMQDNIFDCDLANISTSSEMFVSLNKVLKEAKENGALPIVHIECHGSKDGIQLSSGEFVRWELLKEILTKINIACRNNLLLTLAACEGVYIFQLVSPIHPAPFCGLFGPKRVVSFGDIEKDFFAFYTELLTSLDVNKALGKLNSNIYVFVGCNYMFQVAWQNYYNRLCKGSAAKARVERLVTTVKEDPRFNGQLRPIRQFMKRFIRDQKPFFEKYKKVFFMIDLFPDNRKRFNLRFEDVTKPVIHPFKS